MQQILCMGIFHYQYEIATSYNIFFNRFCNVAGQINIIFCRNFLCKAAGTIAGKRKQSR